MSYALTVCIVFLSIAALPALAKMIIDIDDAIEERHETSPASAFLSVLIFLSIVVGIGTASWTLNRTLNDANAPCQCVVEKVP